jgi:hypothetical protein
VSGRSGAARRRGAARLVREEGRDGDGRGGEAATATMEEERRDLGENG